MRRFIAAIALPILLVLLTGCSDSPPPPASSAPTPDGSPGAEAPDDAAAASETVRKFLEAGREGETGKLGRRLVHFTSEAGPNFRRSIEASGETEPRRILGYDIRGTERRDDVFRVDASVTEQTGGEEPRTADMVFYLRRESGAWRIFKMGPREFQIDFENYEESIQEMTRHMEAAMKKAFEEMDKE
jgi:hypothetical protein